MKYLAGDLCQIREHNLTGYQKAVAFILVEVGKSKSSFYDAGNRKFIYNCFIVSSLGNFKNTDIIAVYNEDFIPLWLVPR